MPTVLYVSGWRLFFYSNENNEPMHIHGEKGDMECKYWLLTNDRAIHEAFAYNMSTSSRREIKNIILQHFDLIVKAWDTHFKK